MRNSRCKNFNSEIPSPPLSDHIIFSFFKSLYVVKEWKVAEVHFMKMQKNISFHKISKYHIMKRTGKIFFTHHKIFHKFSNNLPPRKPLNFFFTLLLDFCRRALRHLCHCLTEHMLAVSVPGRNARDERPWDQRTPLAKKRKLGTTSKKRPYERISARKQPSVVPICDR